MTRQFDKIIIDLVESAARSVKTHPLNLGGVGSTGGGAGAPPGGYIGWLPQTRVAYDSTEAATYATSISGSLLDNLNHIRARLHNIESSGMLIVDDWDGSPTVNPTNHITFSGAVVTNLGNGHVLVVTSGGSGGGTALTVKEADNSPTVTNVDTIVFSGIATVTDLGGGDVLVNIPSSSATVSGLTGGNHNRVLATDSAGHGQTLPWLSHVSGSRYLKWGADVAGDTADSGKIDYNIAEHYLDIYGEGPTVPRKIRMREDVYIDNNLFTNGGQSLHPSKQVTNGDSHDHNGGDGGTIAYSSISGKTCVLIYPSNALGGTVNASSTWYSCPFVDGAPTATERAMVVLRSGTVKNFYIRQTGTQPASGTMVCSIRKNLTSDEISITIPAGSSGAQTRSETATSFSVAAGDFVGFKFINNATAASTTLGFMAVEFIADVA